MRARARTHARTHASEREEKRDIERRSGGVLYWRSEGAEYSAMPESAGFQGERAPFFHPELSVNFKSIFVGGDTNLGVVKRIYFSKIIM